MNLRPLLRLLAVASLPALLPAATPTKPAAASTVSDASKPFTLFMGTDFSVEHGKAYYRVRDVSEGTFVIYVEGRPVFKAITGSEKVGLRVEPSLKLTKVAATVADLKSERAYTPANDPWKKFVREQPGGSGGAIQDLAQRNSLAASSQLNSVMNNPHATDMQKTSAMRNSSMADAALTTASLPSDNMSAGYHAGQMERELAKELYDAVAVTFEVSAETPLTHPYMAMITAFREKGAKPNEVRNWIFAKELNPIESKPSRIKVMQGGLPPGFELISCEVHLYNKGIEVATNVAAKRVPLSPEEAFDFVLMEYVGTHKGATLPPVPAMGELPADFHARVIKGEYTDAVFIKVAKDGRPVAAFRDEACAQAADDAYLAALLKNLRFKPALDKGKPVEGVAQVKLAELPQAL